MRISDWSSDVCSSDLTPEHALAAADAADKARAAGVTLKPLAGVPIGMKDLFCTKGVPSTAGSHILAGFTPPYDSTVPQNIWHAGAVMLGQRHIDSFAMDSAIRTLRQWAKSSRLRCSTGWP